MKTKNQIVSDLKNCREQNSSAVETIRSIKQSPNGILINFKNNREYVAWCLNEVLMIAKQAKIKLKKEDILFGNDKNSLLIPNNCLT